MAEGTSSTTRFRKLRMFYLGLASGVAGTVVLSHFTGRTRSSPPPAPSVYRTELKTDQLITRLDWDDVLLDQAIAQLRSLTGAEIYLDRPALTAARVDINRRITAHLRNATLGRALARVADQMADGRTAVEFGTVDGVILVSTPDAIPLRPIVRVYDVRDIISSDLTLDVPPPNDAPPMNPLSEKERGQVLVSMIDSSSDTLSWVENGGSRAVCAYLSGRLFVCAPPATHRQVEGILNDLREELHTPVPPPQPQVAEDQWIVYPLPSAHLKEALGRKLGRVDIDAAFPVACEELGKKWGVPLFLDLDELHAAGLDTNQKVRLSLKDAPLLDALNRLCADPIDGVKLAFAVDKDSITISTQEHLPNWAPTFVYNIRDMIGGVRYVPNSDLDHRTRTEMIDDLTRLIETTISPKSWKDNGGTTGALRQMYGDLVVTQTWENQQKIQELLARLRAHGMTLHALQGRSTTQSTGPSKTR